MTPWPHQVSGVEQVLAAIERGQHRLILCSPTGGGKTWMMQRLARHFLDQGLGVVLYSHRRLLIDQITDVLTHAQTIHGVRAAGWPADPLCRFQVASIQTEHSRTMRRQRTELHQAALVLVDEGHLYNNPTARAILDRHFMDGAVIVLVTATPVDMADLADELIVAGTNSELRRCGATVMAQHYGPDEPDMKAWEGAREGHDLTEKQNASAIMRPGIFGRVLEHFNRLNPERRPTILFAPSVAASRWFAREFAANGISAAHIDGQSAFLNGADYTNDQGVRDYVLEASRDGRITVVCNRFVLREGIDCPWLAHGIFATVFGSVQSYLQSGGRLLRNSPGLSSVTIQDHGGNWWRHGSLNADREWSLGNTAASLCGVRAERLRKKKDPEPRTCPACGLVSLGGKCPCGATFGPRIRPVVTMNGTLKLLEGDIFRPRRTCRKPDGPKIWERMYWRSRTGKGQRTFAAAMALYARENDWGWPCRDWPFMPKSEPNFFRLVKDVPREELT